MHKHESSDTTLPPDGPLGQPSFYDPAVRPATRSRRARNARDDAWIRAFVQQGAVAHIATRLGAPRPVSTAPWPSVSRDAGATSSQKGV